MPKIFQVEALKDIFSSVARNEQEERLDSALFELLYLSDDYIHELYLFLFDGCDIDSVSPSLKKEVDSIMLEKRAFCCKMDFADLFEIKASTGLPVDRILSAVQENANLSIREIKRKLRILSKGGNANYYDVVSSNDIYLKGEDISDILSKFMCSTFSEQISMREFYTLYINGKFDYVTSIRGMNRNITGADVEFLYQNLRVSSNRDKYWCISKLFNILKEYNTESFQYIPCLYYADDYGVDTENYILMSCAEYIKLIGSKAKIEGNKQSLKNIVNKTYYCDKDNHATQKVFYSDLQNDNTIVLQTFSCNIRSSYPHLKDLRLVKDFDGEFKLASCFDDYLSITKKTSGFLKEHGTSTSRSSKNECVIKPTVPVFSPETYIALRK